MLEYLTFEETRYLAALATGEYRADFWSEEARRKVVEKLGRLGQWALREDAARERLRNG